MNKVNIDLDKGRVFGFGATSHNQLNWKNGNKKQKETLLKYNRGWSSLFPKRNCITSSRRKSCKDKMHT